MTLPFLIEKEFKQIMRNPILPRMIVAFPCIMLLIMPWAVNSEIRNINLSVVDADHSSLSTRLARKAAASGYFQLVDTPGTYPEAMQTIESGDADIILEIPRHFERDLVAGGNPSVLIAANSVNATKAGLGTGYLSSIVADFSNDMREQYAQQPSISGMGPSISIQNLFNPHMNYKLFMVPALMVMLLTILCGFLPAFNIVLEKETGTIEQINVTPVGKLTFILGKLIPYWVIGLVILSICFVIAWVVYGILPAGSVGTIYFFAVVFVLMMTGMGLVVSNYSGTLQQAMFVMFFFVIVFLLMSGLFTPVQSMPDWAQAITVVNPLKYFIQVIRSVYLRGSGVGELLPQLAALGGFALFFNTWAVISYRKKA